MNISFNMSLYFDEAVRMEESMKRQNSTFTLEELEEKRMRMLTSITFIVTISMIIIFIICIFSILHAITREEVTKEEFVFQCRIQNLRTKMNNDIISQHNSSQFMMKNNGTPYNTPNDSSNFMKEELNSHPFNLNENQISYNIS